MLCCSLQFYLPEEGSVNKDFLKAVFEGKKKLLKKGEVAHIEVPYFDELSVKGLWPQFKKDADMMAFSPDTYP